MNKTVLPGLFFSLVLTIFLPSAGAEPVVWSGDNDPSPRQHDWVRLTSDEWLKGKVVALYDDELEFVSAKLGKLTLKWADIAELRTAKTQTLRTTDGQVLEGRLLINQQNIDVLTSEKSQQIPRRQLVSIPAAEKPTESPWKRSVSFGLDVRSGNTDQLDYVTDIELKRITGSSRWLTDYTASFSETDNVETGNSHLLSSSFDWFLSDKLFLRLPDVEYFRDPFQNIENRVTAGIALGYKLLAKKRVSWDVTAGPSYQYTVFDEVPEGRDDSESSAVFALRTRYEIALKSNIDHDFRYKLKVVDANVGKMIHYLETGISVGLLNNLDLNVKLYMDRVEEPQMSRDGSRPDSDDLRLSVGVNYDF